jgi:hypothetical protein
VHEEDARERRRDCPDLAGHPAVVAVVFVIGLIVFLWGLWAAARYMAGNDPSLGIVWWQTSVTFVVITLIAFGLPFRLRFGCNLYGAIFLLLLSEWAILSICFPVARITAQHIATLQRIDHHQYSSPHFSA